MSLTGPPASPTTDPPPLDDGAEAAAHRARLAGNQLFRGIAPEVAAELAAIPELVVLGEDEVVFEEGGEGDALYLVAAGSVRVSKQGRAGRQETLFFFEPGDFFGEMALLDLEPRSAQARIARPAVLGRVDRAAFERLLRVAPGPVSTNLTHGIVARLRNANDQFIRELTRAERLSLIGSMAASITHDFKNPLSAILMAADLIAETSDDPDHLDSASVIRRAVEQMVDMTEELLDFARGRATLRPETVRVDELLADLDETLLGRYERSGIEVVRRLNWRGELWADRRRFGRVLLNVVRNAGEAMPERGVLTLTVERRGDRAAFVVADNGVGIPEEQLAAIFEPFVSHGKPGGTGLGMAIARSVVEGHEGRIWVESTVGEGTTVQVEIPISPAP